MEESIAIEELYSVRKHPFMVLALLLSLCICAHAAPMASGLSKFLGGAIDSAGNLHGTNFTAYWNSTRLVNVGNWYELEPAQGGYVSEYVNGMTDFCAQNGWDFIHNQIFNASGGAPEWVAGLPLAQQVQGVKNILQWFRQTCKPGKIIIDNEVLHRAAPPYAAGMGGSGATGYDWLIQEYTWARQYLPYSAGWRLGINDYDVEGNDEPGWNGDPGATTRYINLCRLLINAGVLDFIGCEGDYIPGYTTGGVNNALNRLGALGLPLYITEANFDSPDDNVQLGYFQTYFPIIWQNQYVAGFIYWSPTNYASDGNIFPNSTLQHSDGSNRPALNWLLEYVPSSNPPNAFASPQSQ
jgi:endo-1,4-beta-xylanase